MRARASYLLWSLAILALDQWTKWMIELHLPPHSVEPLIPGFLNLLHVRNTGVAFGMFSSGSGTGNPLLIVVGLLALGVILLYFRAVPTEERRILTALGLVIGGAAGNLLDRVFSGAVTDFVDVYYKSHHWPAFNVADSAICVGIGILLVDSLPMLRREQGLEKTTALEASSDTSDRESEP